MNDFSQIVSILIPLILSLSVHEFAHAQVAWMLGDKTAHQLGRRTLNPLPHIDPFGTLLFPILSITSGAGFFFGWAKPVPVQPRNLTPAMSKRKSMMLIAAAGPLSNLLLAFLVAGFLKFQFGQTTDPEELTHWYQLLAPIVILNIALFLFNLIPVYPLDGSSVIKGLFPPHMTRWLDLMERNPMILVVTLILVVMYAGEIIIGPLLSIFGGIMSIYGLPY